MSDPQQPDQSTAEIISISDAHEQAKRATAPDGTQRLLVDPMDNVLIGSQRIRKYLGIKSLVTLYEWHEIYALPIMKRADGQWMTTVTAIDEWIWMASQLEVTNRPYSRGDNKRAEEALKKAQRRVDRLKRVEATLGSREAIYAACKDPDA